ncbi:hypothetical protein M8J77_022257 [Diaphorina citri]|nr:hypothetical protein M8J77_022257 [Diaphorina citri]
MVSSFPHLTYQDSLTDQTDGLSAFHTSKIKDGLQEFLMHVFKMCVQAVRRPQLIPMSLVSSFELILTTPLQFQLCFAAVAVQDSRLKSMHRIQK